MMLYNLQAEDLQKSQSNLEQLMEEAALQSQPLVYRNRERQTQGDLATLLTHVVGKCINLFRVCCHVVPKLALSPCP